MRARCNRFSRWVGSVTAWPSRKSSLIPWSNPARLLLGKVLAARRIHRYSRRVVVAVVVAVAVAVMLLKMPAQLTQCCDVRLTRSPVAVVETQALLESFVSALARCGCREVVLVLVVVLLFVVVVCSNH